MIDRFNISFNKRHDKEIKVQLDMTEHIKDCVHYKKMARIDELMEICGISSLITNLNVILSEASNQKKVIGDNFEVNIQQIIGSIFNEISQRLDIPFNSKWFPIWNPIFVKRKLNQEEKIGELDLVILNNEPISETISSDDIICCVEIKSNITHVQYAQDIQHKEQFHKWSLYQTSIFLKTSCGKTFLPPTKIFPFITISQLPIYGQQSYLGLQKPILKLIFDRIWKRGRQIDQCYSWDNTFQIDNINDVRNLWLKIRALFPKYLKLSHQEYIKSIDLKYIIILDPKTNLVINSERPSKRCRSQDITDLTTKRSC